MCSLVVTGLVFSLLGKTTAATGLSSITVSFLAYGLAYCYFLMYCALQRASADEVFTSAMAANDLDGMVIGFVFCATERDAGAASKYRLRVILY